MNHNDEPTVVTVHDDGTMDGHNGVYNKHLSDMRGVYSDEAALEAAIAADGADALAYRVEENRVGSGDGALIFGTSTLLPRRIGDEYTVTRGHLHSKPGCAEVYHCLSGHGLMLLDSLDGQWRALEMHPGDVVHVPGYWVHRSVNVGVDTFVTAFTYDEDAGQNYDLIDQSGGMSHLIVADGDGGWRAIPNPRHIGYGALAAA